MEQPPSAERPVTIGICTSALRSNIEALIAKVSSLTNVTVRFIPLPYNDLDSFRLSSKGLDGVIICHSISNRRFAITNVMDALYDVFLPHVKQVFGKGSVCVIAHDFEWPMGRASSSSGDHARIKNTYMNSFRGKQPTTFNCSNLSMICGRLDNRVDMDEEDWTQLKVFVRQCRVQSETYLRVTDSLKRLISKGASEISRIPAAVRRVYEPIENDSSLPHSHKFVRYILMFVCLPVMLLLMALECSWSLMTWLKDASHSLCTSFKSETYPRGTDNLKRSILKGASEISRIPAAVRNVYEPVENDSPLPHSHKFVRYILMLVCLPVMLILVALECSWSLMMCLKDASHSLCSSFKKNVIDKTRERYQSCRGRSGNIYGMLCGIPWSCIYCCYFCCTLVGEGVCNCLGYRRRDSQFAPMQTPDVLRA